jgi:hypothetical protein
MKAQEIYKRFLLKLNKNDSHEGVNILPSHFILLFNTEAVRWLKEKLDSDDDSLTDVSYDLLVTDVEFSAATAKKLTDSIEIKLPDDFYRHASSYSIVAQGKCAGKIFHFEKKPAGYTNIIADDYSKASYDYEEAPFIVAKKSMKIFFDDFEIKKVFLSYFKMPEAIDMAGYEKIDGSASSDVDCDLSPDNIDEILNRLVVEANRQFENADGFQFSKERVATEK